MATYTQRKEQKSFKDKQHDKARQNLERSLDYGDAPCCTECDEFYPAARRALGYLTCLDCGSPRKEYTIVPVPKSNYVIATNPEQLRSPYSHKGNR